MRTQVFLATWCVCGLLSTPAITDAADDRRLVDAARQRDVKAVQALLARAVDVDARQPDGATALHWAANWGDEAIATLLVNARARADVPNEYGVTPLMLAAENGHAGVVETLLRAGADPNARGATGKTVLMAAARTGSLRAVKALLAKGASVDAREDINGQNALMWAISEGHIEVVRTLLAHGADVHAVTKSRFTPLMFAVRDGDEALARMLIRAGADVNAQAADGATALHVAVVRSQVDLARILLELGADPNMDNVGYTPLHWVAGKWLTLDALAYVNSAGEWSSHIGILAERGQLELMKALLAYGANPNARLKRVPDFLEVARGMFAPGGIPFSAVGATPFWLAARSGDVAAMRLLVAGGGDPLLPASDGTSPLSAAAGGAYGSQQNLGVDPFIPENARLEASRLSLELGADIDSPNVIGHTPLHSTAIAGFSKVTQFLLDRGAKVNIRNKMGDTPLKTAQGYGTLGAIFHFKEVADILVAAGGIARPGVPAPYSNVPGTSDLLKYLEKRAVLVNGLEALESQKAAMPVAVYRAEFDRLQNGVAEVDEALKVYDEVTHNRYEAPKQ